MLNQTYRGKVLWIIVDDCIPITSNIIEEPFGKNWIVVKRHPVPEWKPGMNTQKRNLLLAFNIIDLFVVEKVFIVEDDDYYSPVYLEKMMSYLQKYKMVGEANTVYYNIPQRRYRLNVNSRHSSLFQTAFDITLLPEVRKLVEKSTGFIDMNIWKGLNTSKKLFYTNGHPLSIGIKGLPGRPGIGIGHRDGCRIPDPNLQYFRSIIGEDFKYFEQNKVL